MFENQDILNAASEKRRLAFAESIQRQTRDFDAKERRIWDHARYHFFSKLLDGGVKKARQETVPAYTFERFLELPVELQIQIWSMGARSEPPKFHTILPLSYDIVDPMRKAPLGQPVITGSSRILQERPFKKIPAILQVCHLSRLLSEKVYTRMRCYGKKAVRTWDSEGYFNTLYDDFYFGEHSWESFKILIDVVSQQNTTRQLKTKVQRDMNRLLKIRNLFIDFRILVDAPISIWAEFANLTKITIVTYPLIQFNRDIPRSDEKLAFVKAQKGTLFGNYAAWVRKVVSAALEKVKSKHPEWNVPKVEALVRKLGGDSDGMLVESWTDDLAEYKRADMKVEWCTVSENSIWYERARIRLKSTIAPADIEELMTAFHPHQS
ncbi:uncharacterized protein RSE6_11903 [Rhynchosporium secalis]|uniref:2EXR domain-containing protein n=1 Tax=Rhynchosporium secalis TaxID=38038 RepID=A0A1E1MP45_RHYSE|nr:uncharacterized protein RSE6_11903 [Rhynchosporium secalis]